MRLIESGEWIALAGVFTALVSTVAATLFAHSEAGAARVERAPDRSAERRARGRSEALSTLLPLFAFVSDLEKVARASDRDPAGLAQYVQAQTFKSWQDAVRPVVIGIEVSSSSADARAQAKDLVQIVDEAIIRATFEVEFADEELDSDSEEEATVNLLDAVSRLREGSERLAAIVRDYD